MKKQIKCVNCGKTFCAKATKNKLGEVIELDNTCQECKNRGRHFMNTGRRHHVANVKIRAIPSEFERDVVIHELEVAEMARRRKERMNGQ